MRTHEEDEIYTERARLIAVSARMALALGMKAGFGLDPREDNLDFVNVVFIELEGAGQVSFHVHSRDLKLFSFLGHYDGTWDWHGNREKDHRLEVFASTYEKE